jgi:hypothetical protein
MGRRTITTAGGLIGAQGENGTPSSRSFTLLATRESYPAEPGVGHPSVNVRDPPGRMAGPELRPRP